MTNTWRQAIDDYKSSTDAVLLLGADDAKQIIKLPMGLNKEAPAIAKLQELVGAENVKVS